MTTPTHNWRRAHAPASNPRKFSPRNFIFHQSAKVFSLESFPLYGANVSHADQCRPAFIQSHSQSQVRNTCIVYRLKKSPRAASVTESRGNFSLNWHHSVVVCQVGEHNTSWHINVRNVNIFYSHSKILSKTYRHL